MSETTVFLPPERRPRSGSFIPPLLILPLLAYNFIGFLFMGASPAGWSARMFEVPMVSGVTWTLSAGDLMLVFGIACLFVEILKSTNTGRSSVIEHMLSVVVLVVFLVEFLLVGAAASSVFFLLTIMAAVDVVAGFTVSITGAGRDVTMT